MPPPRESTGETCHNPHDWGMIQPTMDPSDGGRDAMASSAREGRSRPHSSFAPLLSSDGADQQHRIAVALALSPPYVPMG